jgi:heat shock protein HslJ
MKARILSIILALSLFGCSTVWENPNSLNPFRSHSISEGSWQLIEIDGAPVRDSKMRLQVTDNNQIVGHSGCNRFFGKARFEDDQLYVDGVGMTRMLCADEENKQERTLMNMLEIGVLYEVSKDELTLKGSPQLTFKRSDVLE